MSGAVPPVRNVQIIPRKSPKLGHCTEQSRSGFGGEKEWRPLLRAVSPVAYPTYLMATRARIVVCS